MTAPTAQPWELLFPPPPAGAEILSLRFRLLRKKGQPLLLVPSGGGATASLKLYPAQSRKARLARSLAGVALRLGLPRPGEMVTIPCARAQPFLRFLAGDGAEPDAARFAVFFCNPRPGGQRFVLLTFDHAGRPTGAIKAGAGPEAIAVIRREADFLRGAGAGLPAAPKVRGEFASPDLQALALEYVSGETPFPSDFNRGGTTLTPWLQPDSPVALAELAAWHRVREASNDALVSQLEHALNAVRFNPAIHHGDFAPWNIRVHRSGGVWRVLDWERGEQCGPPGWDWFHLILQWAILVERASAPDIAVRLEAFLAGEAFAPYAQAAGIGRCAREMVLAYLLHARDVLRPTEGGPATAELLKLLQRRWLEK